MEGLLLVGCLLYTGIVGWKAAAKLDSLWAKGRLSSYWDREEQRQARQGKEK